MNEMTTMTVLQVAGIVEGAERLADSIGRNGVTPASFTDVVCDQVQERMSELALIPGVRDVAYAPWLRRRQVVYARLSALLTTYSAICKGR